jgi:Domain of unknown function (DUF4055)
MPINSTHPEYQRKIGDITLTTDAFEGDVKHYVPKLSGQTESQYEAYVNRASYYNVVQRTVFALVGALMRKPLTLEGVYGDEPVCADDCDFEELVQQCYVELLVGGRVGLLCDYSEDWDSPFILSYRSEDITNWSDNFVVLREHYYKQDPNDVYNTIMACRYRELFLDENGYYTVRIWEQQANANGKFTINKNTIFKLTETIQPEYRGKKLEFIPFIFCTPFDTSKTVYKPVLNNLAEINIEHFKVAVDVAYGAHFLALPTPYLAGNLVNDQQVVKLGSDEFLQLQQGGTVGFLEFTGSGMTFLLDLQKQKEEQMFSLGSRLLQYKAGVESSDALQVRLGAEGASLVTLTNSLEQALTEVLEMYNLWFGSTDDVELTLNRDYSPMQLAPDDIRVLLEMFQKGAITLDTLMQRLYEGEIVDDVEVEKAALNGEPTTEDTDTTESEESDSNVDMENSTT